MALTSPISGQLVILRLMLLVANPCTKFVVSLAVSKIFHGMENSKLCHVTLTMPLSMMVCFWQVGTCYCIINLCTKFEVSNLSCYKDMNGIAQCTKWGE